MYPLRRVSGLCITLASCLYKNQYILQATIIKTIMLQATKWYLPARHYHGSVLASVVLSSRSDDLFPFGLKRKWILYNYMIVLIASSALQLMMIDV